MGQRSCVYVRYEQKDGVNIVGRYFSWMYGTRMICRARSIIEWLDNRVKRNYPSEEAEVTSIINTNFDYKDVTLSSRVDAFFLDDLNDGTLCIDIPLKGKPKYCFTNITEWKPLNGEDYMRFDTKCCYDRYKWDNEEYRKSSDYKLNCKNIKWLEKHATLMSQEELTEFIKTPFDVPF